MPLNTSSVSRQQFIQAIKAFKQTYKGKLKNLLNQKHNPKAFQAFWENPVIHEYLSRDAIHIAFDPSNRPILIDSETKEQHDETDHYELQIYKHLGNDFFLFRNKTMLEPPESNENFYNKGLSSNQWNILPRLIDQPLSTDIESTKYVSSPHSQLALEGASSFVKKMLAHEFALDATIKRFHPILYQYPNHVSAALMIMDPENKRCLSVILINTITFGFWSKNHWLTTFKNHFSNQYEAYRSPDPDLKANEQEIDREGLRQHIQEEFNLDIDSISITMQEEIVHTSKISLLRFFSKKPPNVLINQSIQTACILALDQSFSGDLIPKEYNFLYDSPHIKKIYLLESMKDGKADVKIWIKPPAKVIDASHHLQTADDDNNCTLYALNFINATINLLNSSDRANEIYQLALDTNQNKKRSQKKLTNIFRNNLKEFLPFYYDKETGLSKSATELKRVHLEQRWNIDGKLIQKSHPLNEPAHKEPPTTHKY